MIIILKKKVQNNGKKYLMINVTKTYLLPNKEKYLKYIDEIYENGWITNNGPLVQKLEKN